MRLPIVLLSAAAMSLTFMTGCDRGHRNPELNPGETENPENEELTAEDQKNKLMDVASEFIGVFNTADQKDAVEAFDWIVYNYMDYSWDGVDEYYSGVMDDIMNMAARTARSLSEGDFTANAALEIYDFPKFTGIFEADDNTRSWVYVGESDNVTLRCKDRNGNPAEAVLTASGEEIEFESEYQDSNDERHVFTVVIPSEISLSVKVGGNEYVSFYFEFDAQKSSHLRINTEVKITNIVYNLAASVEKTSVSAEFTLKYGDRTLLAASAAAPSCVLMDKGDDMDWDEWLDNYYDAVEFENSEIEFGKLMAAANILSQVQIKAESEDPSGIYRRIRNLNEKYEKDYGPEYYDTREYNLQYADLLNENMNISLYYSSDIKQAEIKMEVFNNDAYYYVGPVVYFPKDGTSYAFDEYFTESAFASVIQLTEDLVNKYLGLLEFNKIDPVEL